MIGPGTIIGPYVVIYPHTRIGARCLVQSFVSIGARSETAEGSFIGDGCVIESFNRIPAGASLPEGTLVPMGATFQIRPKRRRWWEFWRRR